MKIIPNFEERIMTGDEDNLTEIAWLVGTALIVHHTREDILSCSFAKAQQGQEVTTRRLLKAT
jgi:hypothetical protein